ncbi:MAG: hypothetical protein JKY56_10055 [Kofleriaceae bacterium]|nr:hypothetical protein [Kofleriaceae bacterium]
MKKTALIAGALLSLVGLLSGPRTAFAEENPSPEQVVVKTAPEPKEPQPWAALLRIGSGVDSNIDLSAVGSSASALGSVGMYGEYLVSPNLRISALGAFEKNLPFTVPGFTEGEIYVGYINTLSETYQLRVGNLVALTRERSVFADGTVLLDATTLQSIVKENLAVILARRSGVIDLEAGMQGNFEVHDGKIEESTAFGGDGILAVRYSLRNRMSLRLRYSYELSRTTGLSARNLAGGADSMSLPLIVGVHRARLSTRVRLADWARAFVRYDFVAATDDFSGFLNSREHVGFVGWIAESPRWTFEGEGEVARRFFTDRIPTIDNPNKDTVYTGTVRVDFWALAAKKLGFFALYRFDRASASPTGLLFVRHIALGGISMRIGATPQ